MSSSLPFVVDEAVEYESGTMKQSPSLDRLSAVTEEESAAEADEHDDECSTTRSHSCAAPAYEASAIYEASAMSLPPVAAADGTAMAEAEAALADEPRAEEKQDLGDPRLKTDCSCCCFGGNSKQGWVESFIAMSTLGIVCGW
jgi:hypothetical protein